MQGPEFGATALCACLCACLNACMCMFVCRTWLSLTVDHRLTAVVDLCDLPEPGSFLDVRQQGTPAPPPTAGLGPGRGRGASRLSQREREGGEGKREREIIIFARLPL